jgi:sugar lactone lactonase YvrE
VYAQQLSVVIPNGDTQASVGVPRHASGFGPQSFSTDRQGNTYICDTANRRIQLFSADGAYQVTIHMQEHAEPNDIAVDDAGSIYVLDETQRMLYQYDQQGRLQQHIPVVVAQPLGPLHIVHETVYMVSRGGKGRDIPIGAIVNGRLEPHPEAKMMPEPVLEGIHGRTSGLLYASKQIDQATGQESVFDRAQWANSCPGAPS